jgi:CheY-like chemotaxis protein
LIVDDSACFLRAARALLEREGLSVAVATSAAEGLRLAEELHPDIVLVDIVLGNEDGFGLARQLASEAAGGPSVVLVSTHAEAEFADLIDQSPADGFLPKAELSASALCRIYAQRGPGRAPVVPGEGD